MGIEFDKPRMVLSECCWGEVWVCEPTWNTHVRELAFTQWNKLNPNSCNNHCHSMPYIECVNIEKIDPIIFLYIRFTCHTYMKVYQFHFETFQLKLYLNQYIQQNKNILESKTSLAATSYAFSGKLGEVKFLLPVQLIQGTYKDQDKDVHLINPEKGKKERTVKNRGQ